MTKYMPKPQIAKSALGKLQHYFSTLKSKKYGNLVIYAITFGIIGTVILIFSSAASTNNFIEPESGAISGNASVVSDATASNGSYVLFQACPAGQTGTPPNCVVPPPPTGGYGTLLLPFTSASLWNTAVKANPTWLGAGGAWSGVWYINYGGLYGGLMVTSPSVNSPDPLVTVTYNNTSGGGNNIYNQSGSNATRWGRPANGTVQVHIPRGVYGSGASAATTCCVDADAPLLVVDTSTGTVHNFWQFWRVNDTTATASGYGVANYVTDTGWGTGNYGTGTNAGINAAGSSQLGGLITGPQMTAAVAALAGNANADLGHALAGQFNMNGVVGPGYVAPAINGDGFNAGFVLEGTHFAIPSGNRPSSITTPEGIVLWNTLVHYGLYVIDIAGNTNTLTTDYNSLSQSQVNNLATPWQVAGPMLQKFQ